MASMWNTTEQHRQYVKQMCAKGKESPLSEEQVVFEEITRDNFETLVHAQRETQERGGRLSAAMSAQNLKQIKMELNGNRDVKGLLDHLNLQQQPEWDEAQEL